MKVCHKFCRYSAETLCVIFSKVSLLLVEILTVKGKFPKKIDSNICSTTHESLTYKNHRIEGLYLYNHARRCMHQIAEEHKSEILSRYIPNCSIHLFLLLFKHFFSQQNKFYAGAAFISTF